MTITIPDSHRDILKGVNFGHFASLGPDGTPQVSPVWVDVDGNTLLINSVDGRAKVRNLEGDNRVAVSVNDQQNPYRYIQIRGVVEETTHEGAEEHIDALAKRYLGVDSYPYRTSEETRIILRIRPERVQVYG